MNLEKIKNNLELKMAEKNITQKDLAENIGMCHTILSAKLKGRRKIILEDVLDILDYFDCDFEDIFRGS